MLRLEKSSVGVRRRGIRLGRWSAARRLSPNSLGEVRGVILLGSRRQPGPRDLYPYYNWRPAVAVRGKVNLQSTSKSNPIYPKRDARVEV